jgi:hypothetical protein
MKRETKIELLQNAFNGNVTAIKTLKSKFDVVEMERLINEDFSKMNEEQLHKCMEYLCFKSGEPYVRVDFSTWTTEELRQFVKDNE